MHLVALVLTTELEPEHNTTIEFPLPSKETHKDVIIVYNLSLKQQKKVISVLHLHTEVLANTPGRINFNVRLMDSPESVFAFA